MDREEIYNRIKEIYEKAIRKKGVPGILKAEKYSSLVKSLNDLFPMLKDKRYTIGMKIYWLLNGYEDFPKCIECGNSNKTNRCGIYGYKTEYCCRKCANGKHRLEKSKKTWIRNYGCDNPMKNSTIQKKGEQTNIKKYGTRNVFQNEDIKKKCEITKLLKYGDPNYLNKEKQKETNIKKYGCENPFGNKDIIKKIKETNIKKYGCDHIMKSDKFKKHILTKTLTTLLHKSYNNHICKNEFSKPVFSEEYYMKHREYDFEFDFECRRCGNRFTSAVYGGTMRRCPICFPCSTTSTSEHEIRYFISDLYNGVIEKKNRKMIYPLELDIYIPEKKIGIEYDGLYWHSELEGKFKEYHLNKTTECNKKGIRLIHIFEDEWEKHNESIKSMLRMIFGMKETVKLNGNETIYNINEKDFEKFHENNSIELFKESDEYYALEDVNGTILSAISVSVINEGIHISSFCNINGLYSIDHLKKCVSFLKNKYDNRNILYRIDRKNDILERYSDLGLKFETRIISPQFWYLKNGCEFRYWNTDYEKIKKTLKLFDETKTEYENMTMNKYTRIWDCGYFEIII